MRCKFNGEAFLMARKQKNYSQAVIAELADASIRYIGALERGEKSNPSADMVARFSIILDTPADVLMISFDEE